MDDYRKISNTEKKDRQWLKQTTFFESDELYEKLTAAKYDGDIMKAFGELEVFTESNELDEGDLEAVTGGYSRDWESAKIVTTTYYEIKKYGRPRTYSDVQISEAVRWVDRNVGLLKEALKMTAKEIKVALQLSCALGII